MELKKPIVGYLSCVAGNAKYSRGIETVTNARVLKVASNVHHVGKFSQYHFRTTQ